MATGNTPVLPLTESQKGLLVVDRLVPTPHLYNILNQAELAPVGPDRLRAALAAMVTVQPMLRARFVESPHLHALLGDPPTPADVPLEVVDVDDEQDLEQLVQRLGAHRFDLFGGEPLYRFCHARLGDRVTLIMVLHHLVADGLSARALLGDLTELLDGRWTDEDVSRLRAEREQVLHAELEAQDRVARDELTHRQAREWADRLRDRPLTAFHPHPHRPAQTPFSGPRRELGSVGSADVQEVCRTLGVSPFAFFTAVYGAVVARYSGTNSVVVGSPFLSRRTAGSFDLAGFFVNTLPVDFDVEWDAGFDDYLVTSVQPAVEFARARSNVAFGQLVQHLRPDRSSNRNPVFSCMLAMQDASAAQATTPTTVRSIRERGNGTAKFDMWLGVTPGPDGWLMEVEYDDLLVPPAVADGFVATLRTAVERAVADRTIAVRDLFFDEESGISWHTDERGVRPPADSLTGWLSSTASARPDAVAVEDGDRSLTYRELADAADEAAAGLVRLGVRAGDVVGLNPACLADTVVATLAILRCGAAYLPLDADLPPQRLHYMTDRARCGLVIGSVEVAGCRTVTLAEVRATASPGEAPAQAGELVYVMFSSGSTGEPKGIEMGPGPLVNLTAWQIDALSMGPDTRFMQYAPLGFDVSFQEIIPTLAAGGTVVSREPADRRDFAALVERVLATRVTHLYLPVAALRPFVLSAIEQGVRFETLGHLCVSGEQLMLDPQIEEFFGKHPECTLVNLYGPTETHAVTTHRLSAADPVWPAHTPIGLPISGVAAYVVDGTGHLAPPGVPGELYLGGACPATGYRNDPERTAQSFLPDRFAGAGVMYRTGDQVLRDERGPLLFLGRDDAQVKIRGYRVELGEIEAAASAVDGVRRAVATTRQAPDGRQLLLFVVADGVRGDEVRERLRQVLPGYMVPPHIFGVDTVPVTVNGKVDHAKLVADAERRISAVDAEAADATPGYRDQLERDLADMWSELLGMPNLPADRSLLECGANSLTVFAALGKARRHYGVTMSLLEFFRTPTIAALAAEIRRSRGEVDA